MEIKRYGLDKKGRYSDAASGCGEIYLSAQTGYDRTGTFVGEGDVEAQTMQACGNVEEILREAGASVQDVCKVSLYVPRQEDCGKAIQTVARFFRPAQPSMSCICVDLEEEKMLVKLDVEAYKE